MFAGNEKQLFFVSIAQNCFFIFFAVWQKGINMRDIA